MHGRGRGSDIGIGEFLVVLAGAADGCLGGQVEFGESLLVCDEGEEFVGDGIGGVRREDGAAFFVRCAGFVQVCIISKRMV